MNMRTIKFRGKNLYNNEWIFGDLIQYESGGMMIKVTICRLEVVLNGRCNMDV